MISRDNADRSGANSGRKWCAKLGRMLQKPERADSDVRLIQRAGDLGGDGASGCSSWNADRKNKIGRFDLADSKKASR